MARRGVGIDITGNEVRAVQLRRTRHGYRLEQARIQAIHGERGAREEGAPVGGRERVIEALKELIQGGRFRSGPSVASAMPGASVFFQNIQTDLSSLEQIKQVLQFELEDHLPLPFEDIVADVCDFRDDDDDARAAFIGGVSRNALRDRMALLRESGIECDLIDAEVCALKALVAANYPSIAKATYLIAYLRETHTILAVCENGHLLSARTLPLADIEAEEDQQAADSELTRPTLVREMELTWRSALHGPIPSSAHLLLGGDRGSPESLSEALREELPCRILSFNPFENVICAKGHEEDPNLSIAMGLAIRASEDGAMGMNFLEAETYQQVQATEAQRGLVLLGLLLVAILGVWCGNVLVQKQRLETEYGRIRNEIREEFQSAFPDERNIVKELAQAAAQLEALRKEYGSLAAIVGREVDPLRILQKITSAVPPELKAGISEFSITGQQAYLGGRTNSFEAVDELRARLEKIDDFAAVTVARTDVDRKTREVRFRLQIALP